MKSLLFLCFAFFMFAACKQTEQTEAITAEITAAQMEGRRAAGRILGPQWEDTLELQKALLDAKVQQSKYLLEGKKECAQAFDSTFISTIRTVNPELAKQMVPKKNNQQPAPMPNKAKS